MDLREEIQQTLVPPFLALCATVDHLYSDEEIKRAVGEVIATALDKYHYPDEPPAWETVVTLDGLSGEPE